MPPPSDPRNLRAKWQRALEERRKASAAASPEGATPPKEARTDGALPSKRVEAEGALPPKRVGPESALPPKRVEPESAQPPKRTGPESALPPKRVEPESAQPPKRMVTDESSSDEEREKKAALAQGSPWGAIGAALVLVGGVGLALRMFIGEAPPDGPEGEDAPSASSSASSSASAAPPVRARCAASGSEPFVIGDAPAPKPAASAGDGEDGHEDELAPFAVEVGRGVRFEQGFAVGTQRQAEGGTVAMIAILKEDGGGGRLVRLARSRGDFDPPVVAPAGGAILAAMMEPNAGGRSIRVAKIEGERVTWGPELSESNDESLAVDIAATGSRAVVVWDDVPLGRERSVIELATFDVGEMRGSGARPVTPPSVDADVPRLAPRPGGFWLSYMVHGEPPTVPTAEKDDGPEDGGKPGAGAAHNPDDSDTEAAGEAIAPQWIELVPLDDAGSPAGAPRAVTPKEGRVIGYDLDDGSDGRAVILYREDDTPTGSTGGRVKVVAVELGGAGEPRVIAEEGVGTGVPMLFGGWVAIHSLMGSVRLGAITPSGDVASELAPETSLGLGEILAAHGDAFLVATPAGRAMKLGVVRCTR